MKYVTEDLHLLNSYVLPPQRSDLSLAITLWHIVIHMSVLPSSMTFGSTALVHSNSLICAVEYSFCDTVEQARIHSVFMCPSTCTFAETNTITFPDKQGTVV